MPHSEAVTVALVRDMACMLKVDGSERRRQLTQRCTKKIVFLRTVLYSTKYLAYLYSELRASSSVYHFISHPLIREAMRCIRFHTACIRQVESGCKMNTVLSTDSRYWYYIE